MLTFIHKKTNELTAEEKQQICDLFANVFNKAKTVDKFDQQFLNTTLGYSYHGLMLADGKIVGSYTSIPFKYKYFGKEYVFALSVDTMIHKDYRGKPANIKKMANPVYENLIKDNIPFVFGFPNENVYLVRKKMLRWIDIGELDYFILPLMIGAIKRKLKLLNPCSAVIAGLANKLAKDIDSYKMGTMSDRNIEKINSEEFINYRYDDSYKKVKAADGAFFVYKIDIENGARTAFVIDFYPLDKRLLEGAVKYIFNNEKDIDAIAYLGKLNKRPINLVKVPKRFEPKAVRMSGRILIDSKIDERVFDINNWNVNLSNFDVR
ncbi:MAG: GNAT family N-acetyltransferase [Candidatus Margulisiibacteriota bacterium]|nr:GNAT family N-acetyltransferase [Candidatus Margulisiibacteriota bacterium]